MPELINDRPILRISAGANHHARAFLPEVTVLMATYNHERYVAEAIESVFTQEYPGTVSLLVSDDRSTDGTRAEIERMRARAPIPMGVILRDANVGGLANLSHLWQRAGGKYIALLEGDDYWTDSTKLAVQVSALEAHPRATMAFGLADALDETVEPPLVHPLRLPFANPTLRDLLVEDFVPTCTVVYRRGTVPVFPDWFAQSFSRDWPLHLLHVADGDAVLVDSVLAVHRLHGRGRWTSIRISERVDLLGTFREELWNRFGAPNPKRMAWLRARSQVAVAIGGDSRAEGVRSLVRAVRAWPLVVSTRGFWYGLARQLVGGTVARAVARRVLTGWRRSGSSLR